MKIKLIDETSSIVKASPSLIGLDSQSSTETPEWVKNFINAENWQASSMPVSELQKLLDQIPELLFIENSRLTTWEINGQILNVDLSLVFGHLASDLLLLEGNQDVVIEENQDSNIQSLNTYLLLLE
ncbi:hypothetical protein THII_1857 [Thioploca ingrica]|uniref:Uncharacterized protein n=1 Tax=Thioploca ingrica TaxID=40754 RepID=A0A090AG82_9GAMM|nr:hypothetical protein THII_1857 [Thioploca ingrica]